MAKPERYAVDPSQAASHFQRLPTVVRDIVRLCDGRRSLEAICASSPLDSGETVDVLRRLRVLGVVVARRAKVRRAPSTPRLHAWLEGDRLPAPEPPVVRVAPQPMPLVPSVVTIDLAAVHRDFSADEERFFASSIDHLIED